VEWGPLRNAIIDDATIIYSVGYDLEDDGVVGDRIDSGWTE
jgi:hypothetical protein